MAQHPLVSMVVMVAFWAMVQLFPQFFIGIFNSDPELLDTAVWICMPKRPSTAV